MQPVARFRVIASDEGIERAKEADEEQRELSFLALWIEPATASNPRNRCFTRPDNFGEIFSIKAEALGCGKCRLGKDWRGSR